MSNWLDVDKEGLKELYSAKPFWRLVAELIQNAWDETISKCDVNLEYLGYGKAKLTVEDDCPTGFDNLRDAYTLFGSTRKRGEPTQRGRFNIGEKLVIVQSKSAMILTTKGGIEFAENGKRKRLRRRRETGSIFTGEFKLSRKDVDETLVKLRMLIPPRGKETYINGVLLSWEDPHIKRRTKLKTEIWENGILSRPSRGTTLQIYKASEKGWLYEMGIPVCELTCPYHVNVMQKVPLTTERDNVPQYYFEDIYAEVLNATIDELDTNDASEDWVRQGVGDDRSTDKAAKGVMNKRWDRPIIASPTDAMSVGKAKQKDRDILYSRSLSKKERDRFKKVGLKTTRDVYPSPKYGGMYKIKKYTPMMEAMVRFTEVLGERLLDHKIRVDISSWSGKVAATYGDNLLNFNLRILHKSFFEQGICPITIGLILHELAHDVPGDSYNHTGMNYMDSLTAIAAKCVELAYTEPEIFDISRYKIEAGRQGGRGP